MLVAPFASKGVAPPIDELVAFGRELQALKGGALGIWILGEGVDDPALAIADRYGLPVTAMRTPGLSHYRSEVFVGLLAQEIAAETPTVVCALHTSQSWEWVPAVAARIQAGCICGVDGILPCEGRLCFQKELYGGKVKGLFASDATATVLTILPGVFTTALPYPTGPAGPITYKEAVWESEKTRYAGIRQGGAGAADIDAAPIIVGVGNGIGNQENIALAEQLAAVLPGAVVAGTRILCDRGWLGYDRQVGISGVTVAPALYIACGISGASQHVLGMRGARFVVAINTDPRAPIFNEADVGVVEDIIGFLPLMAGACVRLLTERTETTP